LSFGFLISKGRLKTFDIAPGDFTEWPVPNSQLLRCSRSLFLFCNELVEFNSRMLLITSELCRFVNSLFRDGVVAFVDSK